MFPHLFTMASNPLSLVSILILIFSTTFALPSSPASTKFIQDDDTTVWTRSEGNGTALAGVTASSLELRGSTFFNCDGSKYRSNLNLASCKDAVDRIPASSGHESYALRGIGQYDVALPSRYISCMHHPDFYVSFLFTSGMHRSNRPIDDGLCTVDVLLKDEASSDRASKQEIKGAALGLLNRCVETQRVGGIAMDIGEGFLQIALTLMIKSIDWVQRRKQEPRHNHDFLRPNGQMLYPSLSAPW